mmetsp:Transcript_54600/g.159388  ORF Transcript_54600/g.159388 Transcript_54600/m.159388 type:complete len:170 (+) Transcript_54600:67-576(+)
MTTQAGLPPEDSGVGGDIGSGQVAGKVPQVYNFSAKYLNQTVLFHVTMLDGSAFVWVGSTRLGLQDFQVATPTPYDPWPCVATLRGDVDGAGANIAQKLSRRFGMLIFLSFNLENAEPELILFTQKELGNVLAELLAEGKGSSNPTTAANPSGEEVEVPPTADTGVSSS